MSYFLVRWIQERMNPHKCKNDTQISEQNNIPREPWMCIICPAGGYCPDIDGHLAIEGMSKKWIEMKCSKNGCESIYKIEEKYKDSWHKRELPGSYCASCVWIFYQERDIAQMKKDQQ